jgi:hypothetical protein
VPITLSGAGQLSSILEPTSLSGAPVNYDIIGVGSGASGFTAHDFGVEVYPNPTPGAGGGAVFHMKSATASSIFNLALDGAYDIFDLGDITQTTNVVDQTYIRSINSQNGNHCFLKLDGGVAHTFVRGIYAEANETTGSQIVCTPSSQVSSTVTYPGVSSLYISDSSFEGFSRGFSFAAAQFNLHDLHFDNLYLDTAANGPSFELFVSPGSSSSVSNIEISNSTLVSASTACVIHGGVNLVKLNNVSCDGGTGGILPPGCPPGKTERGFALIDVSGTSNGGTAYVNAQTSATTSVNLAIPFSSSNSTADIASLIGAAINSSALVVGMVPCPTLVPVQVFSDLNSSGMIVSHASIGSELETYSYQWGAYPTISTSTSVGSGITVSVPNVVSTYSPADGVYVGAPIGTTPSNVAVSASNAEKAQDGNGLHLQGGSALLFSGNHFGGSASNNVNSVEVDLSGITYQNVQLQNNNLITTTRHGMAVFFNPATATNFGGLAFDSNLGFNPFGVTTQQPSISCGTTAIPNPFPFPVELDITGVFGPVMKGSTTIYGASAAQQTLPIFLGIGESFTIACSIAPNYTWFGE